MIVSYILFDSTIIIRVLSHILIQVALGFRIYRGTIINSYLIIGIDDINMSRGTKADITFELISGINEKRKCI
jgi:hypothetical protein